MIPVVFIVDTGSSETFIDEFVVSKFRVLTKNLKFSNSMLMGGTKVDLYKLGKVIFNFRDENKNLAQMEFNNLKVSQTSWTKMGTVYSSTSILGMNFLLENKLTLFVNPDKREGFIEGNV
jgi:ribonuclease HIII